MQVYFLIFIHTINTNTIITKKKEFLNFFALISPSEKCFYFVIQLKTIRKITLNMIQLYHWSKIIHTQKDEITKKRNNFYVCKISYLKQNKNSKTRCLECIKKYVPIPIYIVKNWFHANCYNHQRNKQYNNQQLPTLQLLLKPIL